MFQMELIILKDHIAVTSMVLCIQVKYIDQFIASAYGFSIYLLLLDINKNYPPWELLRKDT